MHQALSCGLGTGLGSEQAKSLPDGASTVWAGEGTNTKQRHI